MTPGFSVKLPYLCVAQQFLTLLCSAHILMDVREPGPPGNRFAPAVWERTPLMVKVEDIQNYGKEHLESVAASASNLQSGVQAIATAYGDYAKKSFEDTKSFVEKLSGVKSLDKALEAQTEFARSSYESFVAESQKIAGLYTDLAKQTFKPYEGLVSKFTPAAR
jgi:hypothetical protein